MSVVDKRRCSGVDGGVFVGELADTAADLANRPDAVSIAENLMRLKGFGFDPTDPDIIRRATDAATRSDALARLTHAPRHEPVVYYMKLGDLVKIGTSTNIHHRMMTIRPQELLAVERGGYAEERARHRAFRSCHVHGEWFKDQDPLTAYIAAVARDFTGDFACTFTEWLGRVRLTPLLQRTMSGELPGARAQREPSGIGRASG